MTTLAALSQRLLALIPGLPAPLAAALLTAAILVGVAPALAEAMGKVEISRGFARIRAWFDLRSELKSILANPFVQEVLTRQGAEAALVSQQVSSSIETSIASSVPALDFPRFSTLQEADAWLAGWVMFAREGLLEAEDMRVVNAYYAQELARLSVPAVIPASLPLIQAEVPGFGVVGVRVRVGVAGAPPVAVAPAPALQPIIVQLPPVTVAPPIVNVAAPNVVVQAPPAAQVQVNAPVDTAPIGLALTSALPLVGAAMASGVLSQGQRLGHLMQLGRNQCFGGTAGALMNLLLPVGLGVFSMRALNSEEGIGGFISTQARRWFEGALDPARFPAPSDPDQVMVAAAARLREAMTFGLQAHMWAILGESNFVLKNLGLPQVAGLMAEMAGFKRLADATMGEVEKAILSTPMRQLAFRTYRPNIPGLGDLEEMYAKKEIPFEAREGVLGLKQALALWGYSDAWAGVYKEHLWKDPRLGEIIRIGQFFNPSLVEATRLPSASTAAWMERAGIGQYATKEGDWYYAWRAAKGGYDPNDVPILVETARRAVTRREQTLFLDAVTRLARDGFIPMEQARELTREGWGVVAGPFASGDPIEARARAIDLQSDYKLLSDTRAAIVMSMARGLVTRDEAREQLLKLGLDGQRVELEVLKATLGMLPGMRIAIERPEAILEEAGLEAE